MRPADPVIKRVQRGPTRHSPHPRGRISSLVSPFDRGCRFILRGPDGIPRGVLSFHADALHVRSAAWSPDDASRAHEDEGGFSYTTSR